jgi:hypothetical protein
MHGRQFDSSDQPHAVAIDHLHSMAKDRRHIMIGDGQRREPGSSGHLGHSFWWMETIGGG